MGNPAADLFNDASLALGWTTYGSISGFVTLVEEGAGGEGQLVLTNNGTYTNAFPPDYLGAALYTLTGDFDVCLALRQLFRSSDHSARGLHVGLRDAPMGGAANAYFQYDYGSGTWRALANGSGIFFNNSVLLTRRPGAPHGSVLMRFTRVGAAVSLGIWDSLAGAWLTNGPDIYSPFSGSGPLTLFVGQTDPAAGDVKVCVRAFLPLVDGALAAPAAPTGGLAFSSPSAGDARLSCAAEWDSLPSNVARSVEYWSATDSGFTANIEVVDGDRLMDGQPLSYRRNRGVAAGTTVYFKCRARDEFFGQLSAFSAVVSAVAAVTPSVSPSFVYPPGSFKRPALEFRL